MREGHSGGFQGNGNVHFFNIKIVFGSVHF